MIWTEIAAFPAKHPYWPLAAFAFAVPVCLVVHHIAFRQLRLIHPPQGRARKVTAAEMRMMLRNQSSLCNNP
jgi:hypothetical protein